MITTEEKDFIFLQFKKDCLIKKKIEFALKCSESFNKIWETKIVSRRKHDKCHAIFCKTISLITYDRSILNKDPMKMLVPRKPGVRNDL